MATSGSGIFGRAKNAANTYRVATEKENTAIGSHEETMDMTELEATEKFNAEQNVNAPNLKQGMTPVKFVTDGNNTNKFKTVETSEDDSEWYNYNEKKWANARTEDGSLWVWIPRYAYRINKPNTSDTEQKGTTDIVFLAGTTDSYVNENGKICSDTKRRRSKDDTIDTTTGWTVHPAFTNESSNDIEFRNGGWDSEITGIWVAKFEAAYAMKADTSKVKANVSEEKFNISSGTYYSQNEVWAPNSLYKKTHEGATGDGYMPARNCVDKEYGSNKTSIKYPTFQGSSYSMNYINTNDAFALGRKIASEGNIYGLGSDTDSHLMKNSEWGAVAYLSKSKYGLYSTDIAVNSKNFVDDDNNVYAGTGYNSNRNEWNDTNIDEGKSSSTTGNVYGIYDMSGGETERTAGYIYNGSESLDDYGKTLIEAKGKSTKYATAYGFKENADSSYDDNSRSNYSNNAKIYGDAIYETSSDGTGKNSWYNDTSDYIVGDYPFSHRGGLWWHKKAAGLFHYGRNNGDSVYSTGMRVTLI